MRRAVKRQMKTNEMEWDMVKEETIQMKIAQNGDRFKSTRSHLHTHQIKLVLWNCNLKKNTVFHSLLLIITTISILFFLFSLLTAIEMRNKKKSHLMMSMQITMYFAFLEWFSRIDSLCFFFIFHFGEGRFIQRGFGCLTSTAKNFLVKVLNKFFLMSNIQYGLWLFLGWAIKRLP